MALVLKTSDAERHRGFESLSLRHPISYRNSVLQKYPRGRRGSPAKGVGCVKRREGSNPSFCARKDTLKNSGCLLLFKFLTSKWDLNGSAMNQSTVGTENRPSLRRSAGQDPSFCAKKRLWTSRVSFIFLFLSWKRDLNGTEASCSGPVSYSVHFAQCCTALQRKRAQPETALS